MSDLVLENLWQKAKKLSLDVVIPIFLLSLILEMVHFFPNLNDINIWDEASYVYSGYRLLTQGQWPNLANSPLASVLYALTTIPVFNSPDFFVLSIAIGRTILFTGIFISIYLIAFELRPYTNPWVILALVFIIPVATTMFLFPSDVLFSVFSGLAFWQMLAYYNKRNRKNLWWASAFMGIGMLARAEGLILLGVLLIVTIMITIPSRTWYREVIAILVPFIVLVGSFILFYGFSTGDFDTGMPERTYYNFQSGHEVIYSQTGIFTPTVSARIESDLAFGTPEENNNSVFRAISRNPEMYWLRVRKSVPSFTNFAIKAYGNKFILIFLWLSIRGMVELTHKRHYPLAVMTFLWFSPLGVGFLNTFFREGYLMMPYFVVFSLSSIGLLAMLRNIDRTSERIAYIGGSLAVILISVLSQNTSMLYRGFLFIFGLVFVVLLRYRTKDFISWRNQALWILLAVVLLMRGGYPSPELPGYGGSDLEKSVYYLQESFPKGSNVLSGSPAYVWAARMTYFGMNSQFIPTFADADEFLLWLQVQEIDVVYVDSHFPEVFKSIVFSLVGNGLQEVYASPEREIIIYSVVEDDQL